MNQTTNPHEEDDMPAEIDFSGGTRGKFYHPDLQPSVRIPMRTMSITEAESRFSELMEQVGKGEEVIIEKEGKPIARLIPFPETEPPRRILGLGRGRLMMAPEDFNTMEAETIRAMFEGTDEG
jgi:prevent-host-death family protein